MEEARVALAAIAVPTVLFLVSTARGALKKWRAERLMSNVEKDRIALMRARLRRDEKNLDQQTSVFEMPSGYEVREVAVALATRHPFLGCCLRLIVIEADRLYVSKGITVHSAMSAREIEQNLIGVARALDRADASNLPESWYLETTTTSTDGDQLSEKLLSLAVYKAVSSRCVSATFKDLEYYETLKDVESCTNASGKVIAKVIECDKNSAVVDKPEYEKRNVFVTGQTGAGKSTICGVLNACDFESFRRNRGSTGTTSVKRAEILKEDHVYRIIDTPGLGDRHGADPVTCSELLKEARMRRSVSAHIHVTKHCPDRAGVDLSTMVAHYGRALGDAVTQRLILAVTYEEGKDTGVSETVDACVEFVSEVMRQSYEEAQKNVITVNLSQPGDAEENIWAACVFVAEEGSLDVWEAAAENHFLRRLALEPGSRIAEEAQSFLKRQYLQDWLVLVSDFGRVTNLMVAQDETIVKISGCGNGVRLIIIFDCIHLHIATTFSKMIKDRVDQDPEACLFELFACNAYIPVRLSEDCVRGNVDNYSRSFYFRIVDENGLGEVAAERTSHMLEDESAAEKVMWKLFEDFVKDTFGNMARKRVTRT